MKLDLPISTELERAICERAVTSGEDVTTYVTNAVVERLAEEQDEPKHFTSHEEFRACLKRIIDLHPTSHHFVDDSRESIYAGRGE